MIANCVVAATHAAPVQSFVKRGVDIYECPTCGCIMGDLAFVPDQYEAADYYTLAYSDRRGIEREWGFRWRYILRKLVNLKGGRRVLDVGAGNGYFVALARQEFGFDAEGIEISSAEIAFAREKFGVELRNQALHEVSGFYDVVTSFNVIEHVKEPKQLLQQMADRVRPGGLLVLTTPNPGCIHRRMKGLRNWGMVDPPHHINLFPRDALRQLIVDTGFTPLVYETLSTYVRFVRAVDTSSLVLRRTLFQALRLLNLGADHIYVAAKSG